MKKTIAIVFICLLSLSISAQIHVGANFSGAEIGYYQEKQTGIIDFSLTDHDSNGIVYDFTIEKRLKVYKDFAFNVGYSAADVSGFKPRAYTLIGYSRDRWNIYTGLSFNQYKLDGEKLTNISPTVHGHFNIVDEDLKVDLIARYFYDNNHYYDADLRLYAGQKGVGAGLNYCVSNITFNHIGVFMTFNL